MGKKTEIKCHCCGENYELKSAGLYCSNCVTYYSRFYDKTIYDENYCQKYIDRSNSEANLPLQEIRWSAVTKYSAPNKRLLDIGCGAGAFLAQAPEDWSVVGFDINPHCQEHCKEQGILMLDGLKVRTGGYGVITMFDVLEHFPNINGTMAGIKEMLSSGGLFVVSMPNFKEEYSDALEEWKHYRLGEHIFYLSVKSMQHLSKKSGFELLEHNFSESEIRKPPADNIVTYIMRSP